MNERSVGFAAGLVPQLLASPVHRRAARRRETGSQRETWQAHPDGGIS
jgi:hypothetical protein